MIWSMSTGAIRWGFAWKKGPFELLDAIGPGRVIAAGTGGTAASAPARGLEGGPAPNISTRTTVFLGVDGGYHPIPAE